MLSAQKLAHRLQERVLLAPMDLAFAPGQLHAILGPNGAGKSTLLRLLSREWACQQGSIAFNGRALKAWSAPELARMRAVLPQTHALAFPFTVTEVVALGRLHALAKTRSEERAIVDAALAASGAAHLAGRLYSQLSGGERARVQLARVLAQVWTDDAPGPRYLLLDEPTAHLDLAFQHACLRLARQWAARGVGVIAVLHDPNLVLSYADTVSVLCCGELLAHGAPADILCPELIHRVYGLESQMIDAGHGRSWLAIS